MEDLVRDQENFINNSFDSFTGSQCKLFKTGVM